MVKLLFVVLFTFSLLCGQAQMLNFYREDLNFELNDSVFSVSGFYFLRNWGSDELKTKIYYPYVYSTNEIDSIRVINCNTMQNIEVFKGEKGHWFPIEVSANDSLILHIKYYHKHNDSLVTYILKTTQFWNKPLIRASYTLRVQNNLKIQALFEPSDSSWIDTNFTYYYWFRENFMPHTDFTINFTNKLTRD